MPFQDSQMRDERVRTVRFVPAAHVRSGEGFRTQGDKYQVYDTTTGEILMQGDCIEVVASTEVQ